LATFLGTLTNLITTVAPATPSALCLPRTPTRNSNHELTTSSPTILSPSQLTRYLVYAENVLGVRHASAYEAVLSKKNYGPDMLGQLPDATFTASPISMPHGDAIRLKRGCQDWLKLDSKCRRRASSVLSSQTVHASPFESTNRNADALKLDAEVRYSIEFPDGGGARYSGPPMKKKESTEADTHTTYFNNALNEWLPVPAGYTAPPYNSEGREDQGEWSLVRFTCLMHTVGLMIYFKALILVPYSFTTVRFVNYK